MTPTPEDSTVNPENVHPSPTQDGERVVISGMAGLYPQSYHIKDLSDILYKKKNPITSEGMRYEYKHPEVVQQSGNVPDLDRFDAQFFKVHYHLGNAMDIMSRKMLEQTFHAIYDAGVNPDQLYGKKIGVYVGICFSETEKCCSYSQKTKYGFGIAGCNRAMFANRISYWLNVKGPSMALDDACCSSTTAMEQAVLAIRRGECEAAVISAAHLCMHPQSSVHYGRIVKLCNDGKTKSFSENADGCAKSEAINVLFLQKAKNALRVYGEVLHAKSEFVGLLKCETGPKFGFYRDPAVTTNFLKKFYEEAKVSPSAIEYVEAVGSATPEADKSELQAIEEVFCKDRNEPLLVGSVMSNIGYNEAAMGISGVTKVLFGYHYGELAANLHCSQPRRDVTALREGRMRIVTEHQPCRRTYAAVNGIATTGINSHILLHGHYKPKDILRYKSNIPHLVTISARQENSVKNILEYLKSRPVDPEELALLHNIHQTNVSGHLGRGFIILDTNTQQKTISLSERAAYFDDMRRPLWFVYSGMGSQWAGMGTQLMRIPIFAAAIERCHQALQPKGIDIVHILTTPDEKIFDNILHSFVGIAAVQIGLTDVLRELGLVPDGIIGHSVGELGCAYADGCLTAEEMILSAYSRGLVSLQTPFIRGSMAAVGMGYEEIVKICPPEIEVACHNGPDSSTISGPADVMRSFVGELTAKGIFAKEVPCSNIAYHSRYIAEAGPGLLKYLSEVIKTPKARSEKWLSTSVPQENWKDPMAIYSSAEYHTNNLLSPVLFDETSRLVPSNAVLVEVAPHGLLQAILKRSMSPECINIPLTRRKNVDNTCVLLEAIGKLYMEGYNPKVQVLYPKVEWPVSTGTPFLSHLVEWAHGEKWVVPLYRTAQRLVTASCLYIICLFDMEYTYLRGHVLRGQTSYPCAAALVAVWDTLAMTVGVGKKQLSVEFRDVHFYYQPLLSDQRRMRLRVALHRGSGYFEVYEEVSRFATGFIVARPDNKRISNKMNFIHSVSSSDMDLTVDDVYQLFEERDYCYSGEFRSIVAANSALNRAKIEWRGNWVTLIDGMLQLNALRQPHDSISTPSHIKTISIDVETNVLDSKVNSDILIAELLDIHHFTRCGGVIIENIMFENLPPSVETEIQLDNVKFISNFQPNLDINTSLHVYLQTVGENISKDVINIVGLTDFAANTSVFNKIQKLANATDSINRVKLDYEQMNPQNLESLSKKYDVVVVQNLSTNEKLCQQLYHLLPPNQLIVSEEENNHVRNRPSALYRVLCSHSSDVAKNSKLRLDLALWRPSRLGATNVLTIRSKSDFSYATNAHINLGPNHRLLVFTPYPAPNGVKELVRNWKKDGYTNVHLIMADDVNSAMNNMPEIDLVYNVLKDGEWGGEYYLPEQDVSPTPVNMKLQSRQIGDYNSLIWVEAPEPASSGITVTVEYAGIHNSDFKKAKGVIPLKNAEENCYGMDFSGTTESGQRVMGIVPGGACGVRVRALPELLWPVPAHWTLEDAATVPFAYAHAFYLLAYKGFMLPGINILIHGGTGALGQAAITIALAYGCTVFTTVSDIRKKRFLKKLFPELKDEHIGNSRDHSFSDMVLSATNGKGCDIVISSVKKDLKNISSLCGSYLGNIIDTVQIQDHENYSYGMNLLGNSKSYFASDFISIVNEGIHSDIKKIQLMVSDGIARGHVRPLTRVTYAPDEAARAFQLLDASRHRGRVLLRMRDSLPCPEPRLILSADNCHVILCGDGAFGLHLADRLVARGARKLHIHSKIENSPTFKLKIESLQTHGVDVATSSEDLNVENNIVMMLNNAQRVGHVEGLYVTVDSTPEDDQEALLTRLDSISRKLCPNMKYFAVVSGHSQIGQNVCSSRVRSQLPVTVLTLPDSQDSVWAYKSAWRRCAVDAVELALRRTPGATRAHTVRSRANTPLDQLAAFADIKVPEHVTSDTTLGDLCNEPAKLRKLTTYLQSQFNMVLEDEKTSLVTIEKIQKLCKSAASGPSDGLATFFRHDESDELLATTDIVIMPTLTTCSSMRDDEFDLSRTHFYIIPGLEGLYKRFHVLCERLKLPTLVLQPGLDNLHETPREQAQRYCEILLKKAGLKNNFYLLGYEYGFFVALEVAAILEDHGLTGTIFCLGCTPEEFQVLLREQLTKYSTKEQLEDAVVRHMFTLMTGEETAALEKALQNATTWSEKVDACVRTLLGRVSRSAQYVRALMEAVLTRITQAQRYKIPMRPLRSKLVLLHAVTKLPAADPLIMHSQHPINVHQLRSPLAQSANDLECATIITQYLDPSILEEFDKKNTCETYLLNANSYSLSY